MAEQSKKVTTYTQPAARSMVSADAGSMNALRAEIERLKAENEALTAWGKQAYAILVDVQDDFPGRAISAAAWRLCDNAPNSVKG